LRRSSDCARVPTCVPDLSATGLPVVRRSRPIGPDRSSSAAPRAARLLGRIRSRCRAAEHRVDQAHNRRRMIDPGAHRHVFRAGDLGLGLVNRGGHSFTFPRAAIVAIAKSDELRPGSSAQPPGRGPRAGGAQGGRGRLAVAASGVAAGVVRPELEFWLRRAATPLIGEIGRRNSLAPQPPRLG
jgi:hypothetical protein